ncbi:MAG: helix-turn-helix domain-containing protein [Rectinemataceae bacterium]
MAFGILLSFFFSSLLIAKPCRNQANRYLAGVVLSSGISISYQVLYPTGLYRFLPHLVKVYIPPQFLIGPLLFLYVSALTEPDFRLEKRRFLHFPPFFLSILYLTPFFIQSAQKKIAFVQATISPVRPSSAEEWTIWLCVQASLWGYSILSFGKYRRYRKSIRETVSNLSRYAWNWMLIFLISVQILLCAFLIVDIRMLEGIPLVAFNAVISGLLTGSIVFLGWRGLLQLDYISPSSESEDQAHSAPARKSNEEECKSLFGVVMTAVRRGSLFRSSELTLPELAEILGYSRTELSRIINLGGGMSFYDFINKLRIEDVQERLKANGAERLSVLEAAFDSGFNTKSTFHVAFKKWTGLTPSLYRKQVSRLGQNEAPGKAIAASFSRRPGMHAATPEAEMGTPLQRGKPSGKEARP